jgi:ADP-ribosylglycohydrolase
MFLGLAIGDALGNTTESMVPMDRNTLFGEIDHYLPNRHANGRQVGLPSDDTQLCAWAIEQILRDGGFDPTAWLNILLSRQVFGMGGTVRAALRQFELEGLWSDIDQDRGAAGNGALMRCAGIFAAHLGTDGSGLAADAALFAAATHNDFAAVSSAVAFTLMLAELLTMPEAPPTWWVDRYLELAAPLEGNPTYRGRGAPASENYSGPVWRFVQENVPAAVMSSASTQAICDHWYSGAYLLETVPSVLFILSRHGADPYEAICRAVNDTRDNDTIAAVVGAAVGALYGEQALPPRWRSELLGRTGPSDDGALFMLLERLAVRIAERGGGGR